MPGYRTLPSQVKGQVAELVRFAEQRQQNGDLVGAAALLELAIDEATSAEGQFPSWTCGRLAAIYRSLSRYDDEVALLERYCESSVTDEARTRFIARLSKARTLAARYSRPRTGALRTVGEVRSRTRTRHSGMASDAVQDIAPGGPDAGPGRARHSTDADLH